MDSEQRARKLHNTISFFAHHCQKRRRQHSTETDQLLLSARGIHARMLCRAREHCALISGKQKSACTSLIRHCYDSSEERVLEQISRKVMLDTYDRLKLRCYFYNTMQCCGKSRSGTLCTDSTRLSECGGNSLRRKCFVERLE